MQTPVHKIIITGTGRAGTTFLVRLLTELGLDTGYTSSSWRGDFHTHCMAGLEHNIFDPEAPYVVKNPALCTELEAVLSSGEIVVDYALIPIRELSAAARSRIRVGGANGSVPGGLWMTDKPDDQQAALAAAFHQLVHTLTAYEVPHAFLDFPRFVQDSDYAFAKLKPVLGEIGRERFGEVFARIADPSLVHDFSRENPAQVGEIGRSFFRKERHLRRRRAVRRALGWTLAVCLVSLVAYQFVLLARVSGNDANGRSGEKREKTQGVARPFLEKKLHQPLRVSGRGKFDARVGSSASNAIGEIPPLDFPH